VGKWCIMICLEMQLRVSLRPQKCTSYLYEKVPMCYAGLSLGGPLETQFEGSGITYLQRDSVAQLLG
jgi:hypothetical protein